MKTSKIIFLSLLISIALFILAAFVDVRINGKPRNTESELVSHETPVPEFKVLVINNSNSISILQESTPSLKLQCKINALPPQVKFSVRQDTLIISDVKHYFQGDEVLFVRINATDSLCSILANNSDIRVESPFYRDLSIVTDSSKVFISNNTTSKPDDDLIIHARNNSRISSGSFSIDSLGVFVERSEALLSIRSNVLHGSASGGSMISTIQPLEIFFKCDSTSKLRINTIIDKY